MKTMLKVGALILSILLMVLTIPMTVSAATVFQDVPEGAWYEDAVESAYQRGYFHGTSATTFSPEAPMTRAMFVQVLANMTEDYTPEAWSGRSGFSDVPITAWYASAVEWAFASDLIHGVGNHQFAPTRNLTRQEMAVILYNYAEKTGNDLTRDEAVVDSFGDADKISSWARNAMIWAVSHQILQGSGGNLNPTDNAKRCQVAQVTVRAAEVMEYFTVGPEPVPSPVPTPSPTPTPSPVVPPAPAPDPVNQSFRAKATFVFTDGSFSQSAEVEPDQTRGSIAFPTLHTYATSDWDGHLEIQATGEGPFTLKIGDVLIDTSEDGNFQDTLHLESVIEQYKLTGGAGELKWQLYDAEGRCIRINAVVRVFGREDTYQGADGSTPDPDFDWGDET